jgi:hypothetical protein
VPWALKLADRCWPADARQQLEIALLPVARNHSWIAPLLLRIIEKNEPHQAYQLIPRLPKDKYELQHWAWLLHEKHTRPSMKTPVQLPVTEPFFSDIEVRIFKLKDAQQRHRSIKIIKDTTHPEWWPFLDGISFTQTPSKESLAQSLQQIAKSGKTYFKDTILLMPWVLSSCLYIARNPEELKTLADHIERGELGDSQDWIAAEERWSANGVTQNDLLAIPNDGRPFSERIADSGFPLNNLTWYISIGKPLLDSMLHFWQKLDTPSKWAEPLGGCLDVALETCSGPPPSHLSPPQLDELIQYHLDRPFNIHGALTVARWTLSDSSWLQCLEKLIASGLTYNKSMPRRQEVNWRLAIDLVEKYPSRESLLQLAAIAARAKDGLKCYELPDVRFDDYEALNTRWAALAIELARGEFFSERATELATATTELQNSKEKRPVTDLLTVLARHERYYEDSEHYLLELQSQLPELSWRDHTTLVGHLDVSFRRRRSNLSEPAVWEELQLPAKLRELAIGTGNT